MKRELVALAILLVSTAAEAAAENKPIDLSIKDAIRFSIERNLDLKAELYNPAQAEAEVRKNRAIYETHLTMDTSYADSRSYSAFTGKGVDQSTLILTPGAYQLLPTGGTVNLSFQNIQQKNNTAASLGTYWASSLLLSLNQPLLKNFGTDATELGIKVSEFSRESSIKHLKSRLLANVAQVWSEYYKLGSLRQDLQSKNVSLELARKVLGETESRVKAGVMPAMEILNAQFGASSREKDLIDAEKAVQDQMDVLRLLLQLETGRDINPTDLPILSRYVPNEDESIKKAISARPELDELMSQLAAADLQTKVSKGQTLPSLNLASSVGLTGQDSAYGKNVERTGTMNYPYWSVGLQLDYPLGNQSAVNDYIKNRLKSEQIRVQIDSLKSSIESEVRTAIRGVTSSFKQLDVTDRGKAYAEERLKAYMKKIEVGLATNKDLLDVENDLATARSNQIKAQVAYTTALSQLWKSTGELLDREGVTVDMRKLDNLYNSAR